MPSSTSTDGARTDGARTDTARRTVLALAAAGSLAITAGCTVGQAELGPATSTTTVTVVPGAPRASPERPAPSASSAASGPAASSHAAGPPPAGGLRAALQAVVDDLGGTASVAVSAGGHTVAVGDRTEVAWSTSKVPVAVAAVRAAGVTGDVRSAIIASNNAAAENMWASLGTPAQAGRLADRVLADGGDTTTTVQTERVRSGYTAFGQTQWRDSAAAGFASRLPCIAKGPDVLALMRSVAGNQQWGLYGKAGGPITSIGVKGGWGPLPSGNYLVRQLAVVQTDRGYTGVMISSTPSDGTMSSGEVAVTRVAAAIAAHAAELPAARC